VKSVPFVTVVDVPQSTPVGRMFLVIETAPVSAPASRMDPIRIRIALFFISICLRILDASAFIFPLRRRGCQDGAGDSIILFFVSLGL
jgi:hypothetical protein